MADVKKTTGVPDEQGKDVKKVGEIKFKIPLPAEEQGASKPPGSFILETEITRQRSKTGAAPDEADEEGAADTPTTKPVAQPAQQEPTPPTPTSPTPRPGSPKAPTPPAPAGPSPSGPQRPSPQTPSPGTMDTGPRPQASPQAQKPAGKGPAPVRPLGDQLQERSQDEQGNQGPTEGAPVEGTTEGEDQGRNQPQAEPGNAQQQQNQIGAMAELVQQEAEQKARLAREIQSDERAAGRAHLIELIAQGIVTGLEFVDSLLKFLGNIAKPIPIIGWVVQIIVWIARAIVTVLEFLPKGVAKGERKDEDRLRLRASKLRKEGNIKSPPAPDNPHGTTEASAEGLTSDNVRLPVLSLLRPSTEPFNLLPGLFKINPPLAGILRIFIIAGTAAVLLIGIGGLVIFKQSSQV